MSITARGIQLIWGATVLAGLLVSCSHSGGTDSNGISLEEVWSTVFPSDVGPPTGLSINGDTVVAWSSSEHLILVIGPGSFSKISLPGTAPVAAKRVGALITVIESQPPALVELPTDGSFETRTEIRIPGTLFSAAAVRDAWYLVSMDESRFNLYQLATEDGSVRKIASIPDGAHLSSSPSVLLLSHFASPFQVDVLDRTGVLLRSHRISEPMADSLFGPESGGYWVALPALEMNGGTLLQTVTDVRSDRRVLLRYSPASPAPIRVTQIDMPMAFVAADPQKPRVAGIRNLNAVELVVYGY